MIRRRAERRQSAAVLGAIAVGTELLPADGSIEGFIANLAARRQRPIKLERWPLGPTDPTGIWISTTDFDAFITREDAQPTQREASLLHEAAHMLLDHAPDDSNGAIDFATMLAPSLDPDLVRHIMSRHSYDCPIERDAELCATLLAVGVRRARREVLWTDQASTRMR